MSQAFLNAFLVPDPLEKARLTRALSLEDTRLDCDTPWPDRPGRPAAPRLVEGRKVPKRSPATPEGRIALLHALAHIELNAIDLALDIIGRFRGAFDDADEWLSFRRDWLGVATDEARHFQLLAERLKTLASFYGALTAHDGLWQAALRTADDLLGRLAIAPLTHEARGLDVTPAMIEKLRSAGDPESAAILNIIYEDEIGHVATGARWFDIVCRRQGLNPTDAYRESLERIGLAKPHPPFNEAARRQAGLSPDFDVYFSQNSRLN